MFKTPEQFASANKATVDSLLSLANTALASAERIAALNLNTARAAVAMSGRAMASLRLVPVKCSTRRRASSAASSIPDASSLCRARRNSSARVTEASGDGAKPQLSVISASSFD